MFDKNKLKYCHLNTFINIIKIIKKIKNIYIKKIITNWKPRFNKLFYIRNLFI